MRRTCVCVCMYVRVSGRDCVSVCEGVNTMGV